MLRFVCSQSGVRHAWLTLGPGLSLLAAVPSMAHAQKGEDTGFSKRDSVVIAVPTAMMTVKVKDGLSIGYNYDIDARLKDGTIEVLDPTTKAWRSDWRSTGFPPTGRYDIQGISKTTRTGTNAKVFWITVNTKGASDYRIFVPVDQPEVARALMAPVAAADSVLAESYIVLGSLFFVGPLAGFTSSERTALLTWAHLTANGTTIGSEEFKGLAYMTVTLPPDGNTWNDLKVTRTQRIGKLSDDQLALLKAFAKIAAPHGAIAGLKLQQESRHGTAPYYGDATSDRVDAYFPLDAILSFANFDMTSQALINKSIILVDNNRVDVDLSTQ